MLADLKNPNCWRRCTTLEKCLLLMSAFACMANGFNTAILKDKLMADNKIMESPVDSKLNEYCVTDECSRTASEVLSKMNIETEPCENFYQFACGNFINKTEITNDQVQVNIFTKVTDKLRQQLKDIITEEKYETEVKPLRLPNALYKACMNETLIESLGTKPIEKFSNALGGWPVVVGNSWDCNNTWTWQETVKKFNYLGFSVNNIFAFDIIRDLKNSTRYMIDLNKASLGLSWEYLIEGFNNTLVAAYYKYMVDIAVLFGAEEENASKELKESLQFEMDLANISLPSEERRTLAALYNLRNITEMQDRYKYVQWMDYINALLPENVTVDENEIINLEVPEYFDDLGKLLNRTDKRVIANYMMWHMHKSAITFLPQNFRNIQLRYSTALTGKQEQEDRWKQCVNYVSQRLQMAVGSLYVRKYFKEDSKADALELVNNIHGAFSQMLDEIQWMNDETLQKAKFKLQLMANYIGYPDEILDNNKLENYYNKLEIDPDKYLESVLNMNRFYAKNMFSKLRLPVNKADWKDHAAPAVVNAFYNLFENSIQFPAGIWQDHIFDSQRPKYMNYGAMGFIIGHEITHGFGDKGSQADAHGNLVKWWDPETSSKFVNMTKCIIEQYGNYTDKQTGLNLNGIITQGENIADNGGVKVAYRAYNQWAAKNGQESRLPGLNYSPQQMFWISYAQTWCSKYRTEYLSNAITTDKHSPGEFRVLGPLSNMKQFSQDFQCLEGTPMNPVHKCAVW